MINKLNRYCKKLKEKCKYCDNSGCLNCGSKINRTKKYYDSDIPVEYWNLSIKNFEGDKNFKKLVQGHLRDIDTFYDKGKSLMFVGSLGTGKTYAACCYLKLATTKEYICKYTNMADIVNKILSPSVDSSKYLKSLIDTDFLVIDEFDARWIFPSEKSEQIFGSSLEYVLRTRFQNHLPTILCSNTSDVDTVLDGYFAKAFASLRRRYVDVIYVSGKDYRRRTNND
tara:strand:+ start:311 stop:988 length:678 start_codon:yes stop_codon:yes gene_type:complete